MKTLEPDSTTRAKLWVDTIRSGNYRHNESSVVGVYHNKEKDSHIPGRYHNKESQVEGRHHNKDSQVVCRCCNNERGVVGICRNQLGWVESSIQYSESRSWVDATTMAHTCGQLLAKRKPNRG